MALGESIALFMDAENLARGAAEAGWPLRIEIILDKLSEEGTLRFARAYGDWTRPPLSRNQSSFREKTVEMVMLATDQHGKNTADMQMAMDALEMALLRDSAPTTIVIASGDRDFVPLAQKVRRYGVKVIGVGINGITSRALAQQCDQFLYYDELIDPDIPEKAEPVVAPAPSSSVPGPDLVTVPDLEPAAQEEDASEDDSSPSEDIASAAKDIGYVATSRLEAFKLVWRAANVLARKGQGATLSAIGQLVRQFDSTFDPERYSFRTLKELVTAAESAGWVTLEGSGDSMAVEPSPSKADQFGFDGAYAPAVSFTDPESLYEDYRQVLIDKRIPLLPWAKREQIVKALWAAMERSNGQMLQRDAVRAVQDQEQAGDFTPINALRKLIITMAIGECFTGLNAGTFVDEWTMLQPKVNEEEAHKLVDRTYIRGILIDYPTAPLSPEPVAQLLYGSTDDSALAKARAVIADMKKGY